MNKTKTNFFACVYYSISGFDKYRLFLRHSVSRAVVYLLLVSMLIALVVGIPAWIEYTDIVDEFSLNIDTIIPDFTLDNGKLEVKGEMPIILGNDTYPVVIDTSLDAENKILNQYDIVMLITSDRIIQKNYVDKADTPLSMLQGLTLTRDSLAQTIPVMKPVGIFVFLIMGIFFILGKFISALVISLIGRAINSAKRTNLSYQNIFKISAYSMTLPLLVCTALNFIPAYIPFVSVIFYAIASVYVYGAINNIRKEIDKMSQTSL